MEQPQNHRHDTNQRNNIRYSYIVAGIALFLIGNVIFWLFQPLAKVDPESLPAAHTWTWWATREYLNQKIVPQVVILGSSLMMHPISRQDANYVNKDLDYVHHHRSDYLNDKLSNTLGLKNTTCFNFALPGSMISDDYIVARALLNGDKKPKVLVLGLSLRDFIDSGVTCPASTPPFRYLKRFVSINDIVDLAMPQIWQRIDYCVGNLIYLWKKKLDLQVVLAEDVKKTLGPYVAQVSSTSLIEKVDPTKNLPSNLRSEVEEHMFIVKHHQPYTWEDNSKEYIKRYHIKECRMFEIQTQFLNKLFDYCQNQNIAVLVVNMPLTEKNLALMPTGYYSRYLITLKTACASKSFPFVDLNYKQVFQQNDFYDTAHMNASGGQKLLDAIAFVIKQNPKLANTLISAPPVQLATHDKQTWQ